LQYLNAHCHTEYSNIRLLDCINKIDNTIDHAIKIGYKGLAITDHGCLSGHVKAIKYIREGKEKGSIPLDFKIILGEEIYLIDNIEKYKEEYDKETMKYYHFILLAKDKIGHKQLRKISSKAWENSFNQRRMDRVPITYQQIAEIVEEDPGHLIGSTACLGSFFAQKILGKNEEEAKKIISWGQTTFGKGNFFIEIQPSLETPEQKLYNLKAYNIAQELNVPVIVTTDAHYLTKEDRKIHKAYLNSKEGDREVDAFYGSTYLMSTDEIKEYLEENGFTTQIIEEVINNTMKIYDLCQEYDLYQDPIVPTFTLPTFKLHDLFVDKYGEYEYIRKFGLSDSNQDKYLLYQIEKGMIEKYVSHGLPYGEKELDRINIELGEIWKISDVLHERVAAYYNTMKKIIDIMWEDGDSIVGPARGSVTGYYIAYLIDITQVNPLVWDLPYWRHLTSDRPELPKTLGISGEPVQGCAIVK
jgi:DNA polymerase III subunit alpha